MELLILFVHIFWDSNPELWTYSSLTLPLKYPKSLNYICESHYILRECLFNIVDREFFFNPWNDFQKSFKDQDFFFFSFQKFQLDSYGPEWEIPSDVRKMNLPLCKLSERRPCFCFQIIVYARPGAPWHQWTSSFSLSIVSPSSGGQLQFCSCSMRKSTLCHTSSRSAGLRCSW